MTIGTCGRVAGWLAGGTGTGKLHLRVEHCVFAALDDRSAELLQLQLSRRAAATVAHVLDSGATVFPDVRVRTVSHAVPSQVVVTGHGSQHVHGSGSVHALVSCGRNGKRLVLCYVYSDNRSGQKAILL